MIDLDSIKRTPIIIGIVMAVILGLFLSILGFIIATIFVGYSVDGDFRNGAVHGALVGIIGAIIGVILGLIFFSLSHMNITIDIFGISWALLMIIVYTLVGAVGGAVGVFIKDKTKD